METVGLEINRDLRFGLTAAFVLRLKELYFFPANLSVPKTFWLIRIGCNPTIFRINLNQGFRF